MKIYVTHSTGYDFRSELYVPLKTLANDGYRFIFPHEDDTFTNSKEIIRTADIVIAEVSYPSTGQGIELGWADDSNTPVVCISKVGMKISGSLQTICNRFSEYNSPEDLPSKVKAVLATINL